MNGNGKHSIAEQVAFLERLKEISGFSMTLEELQNAIVSFKVDKAKSKVMVAIPLYKHLEPDFFEAYLKLGLDSRYVRTSNNLFINFAREQLCQRAIDEGFEYIFFMDDDIVLPVGALPKLVSLNYDIVSGLYHQKGGEYLPNIYNYKEFNKETGWHDWNNIVVWEDGTVVDIQGAGFGCMLIKTEVLKKLPKPWFGHIDKETGEYIIRGTGEDLEFCKKAIQAGYKVYCATEIKAAHVTTCMITTKHFWAKKLSVKHEDECKVEIDGIRDKISERAQEVNQEKERELSNAI